ncbi:hypothetical protein [Kangiella shandongensis]|uniref:hypothetical protein n=1 Tax=Kangiella shandongensis TaxID=2763258 RepID=UPI001CC157F8|nr:hypothetical protein [Kangiella shandongensis]
MKRTVIKLSLILGAALIVQSCKTTETRSVESPSEDVVSGSYIYGHEVNSFQPCGEKIEYWVVGNEGVMSQLSERYTGMVGKPYQPVYVSFRGDKIGKATDGFASDYDGQFKVREVVSMTNTNICQ